MSLLQFEFYWFLSVFFFTDLEEKDKNKSFSLLYRRNKIWNIFYLISCASRISFLSMPKSTRNWWSSFIPPFSTSISSFTIVDPYLEMSGILLDRTSRLRENFMSRRERREKAEEGRKIGKEHSLEEIGIKLFVPWLKDRRGHVQTTSVQA